MPLTSKGAESVHYSQMVLQTMLGVQAFFLRPTNYFPAGWYNDHICVFERSLWGVAQRKDVRGKSVGKDWGIALVSHSQARNWNQSNKISNVKR